VCDSQPLRVGGGAEDWRASHTYLVAIVPGGKVQVGGVHTVQGLSKRNDAHPQDVVKGVRHAAGEGRQRLPLRRIQDVVHGG
jgi:hypothetical protein